MIRQPSARPGYILVVKSHRTLRWEVKYTHMPKNGKLLHRTIECGSPQEAAARAIEMKLKGPGGERIIAPPEVSQYF